MYFNIALSDHYFIKYKRNLKYVFSSGKGEMGGGGDNLRKTLIVSFFMPPPPFSEPIPGDNFDNTFDAPKRSLGLNKRLNLFAKFYEFTTSHHPLPPQLKLKIKFKDKFQILSKFIDEMLKYFRYTYLIVTLITNRYHKKSITTDFKGSLDPDPVYRIRV